MKASTILAALACGAVFGLGLAVSTMVRPESVLDFLNLRDLGLLFVLGGAVSVTLIGYQVVPRLLRRSLLGPELEERESGFSVRTVAGAAIFGAGWGLCGVCPGPALAGLGAGNWPALFALAGILAGAWIHGRWFERPG